MTTRRVIEMQRARRREAAPAAECSSDMVGRTLVATVLFTASFGSSGTAFLGLQQQVPLFWIPGSLLISHDVASMILRGRASSKEARLRFLVLTFVFLLIVPMSQRPSALEIWGLTNVSVGAAVGVSVALHWSRSRAAWTVIDWGFAAFVVATSFQLLSGVLGATSTREAHQATVTGLGGSNYVAAMLVVTSIALLGRLHVTTSLLIRAIPFLGVAAAVSTLSRGAAIAAFIGLTVQLVAVVRVRGARIPLLVVGTAFGVLGAQAVFARLTALRAVDGYDPSRNVDARLMLYDVAWQQFLSSPMLGTGWYQLRDATWGATSFAHNVFLSFLQVAGLFGGLAIVVLTLAYMAGVRRTRWLWGSLTSLAAIVMVEPFLEGSHGSFLAWCIIGLAYTGSRPSAVTIAPLKETGL